MVLILANLFFNLAVSLGSLCLQDWHELQEVSVGGGRGPGVPQEQGGGLLWHGGRSPVSCAAVTGIVWVCVCVCVCVRARVCGGEGGETEVVVLTIWIVLYDLAECMYI